MTNYILRIGSACLAWGLVLVVAGAAHAYDFSAMGFSDGESLEGIVLDGATFTSETGDLQYYTNYGGGVGTGYGIGSTGDIYIEFALAVSAVSFTAGDGAGDDDAFAVTLFEFGTGDLIGTWASPVFGGVNEPEWYTLNISALNIGSVVFDPGNSGVLPGNTSQPGGIVITDMSYDGTAPVPEPSAALLFGLGSIFFSTVIRAKRS